MSAVRGLLAYDTKEIYGRVRIMLLNHVGKPSLYLPFCMIMWGLISLLTGENDTDFYFGDVL